MNANEPLMRRRKDYVMSKPMGRGSVGTSSGVTQVPTLRHPAYRRHEFHLGFSLQLRDPLTQMKIENLQVSRGMREKVEKLWSGADPSIRALNAGNAAGAKGWA
jgi:hypothetical protein